MHESRWKPFKKAVPSRTPNHFDIQSGGLARGKNAESIIAGQITPTGNDFLALWNRTTAHTNLCADSPGVRRAASQTNRDARSRRIISHHQRTRIHIVIPTR